MDYYYGQYECYTALTKTSRSDLSVDQEADTSPELINVYNAFMTRTIIGVGLFILYLVYAPILMGHFVFYYHPAFSAFQTALYILIGLGFQIAFCMRKKPIVLQVVIGLLYFLLPLLKSNLYQS